MDLIERYNYAVTRGLPRKQRDDVAKELRSLIDDMLSKYSGPEPYEEKVKKVLLELGDPEVLANNYRGENRYLIGPRFYDIYLLVLKIVLGAIFLGITIALVVKNIVSGPQSVLDIFSGYFSSVFSALLQGAAWVTLAFALVEHKTVGKNFKKEAWNISNLPQVPQKKALISPAEPIVAIIFSTIFLCIIYFAPRIFAVYFPGDNGTVIIPILNLDVLNGFKLLFVTIYLVNISKEIIKLIAGRWTLVVAILLSVLSVAAAILLFGIFLNPGIWNPNFASEIMMHTKMTLDFAAIWSQIKTVIVILIAVGCIIDVITTLIKGIKYSITQS